MCIVKKEMSAPVLCFLVFTLNTNYVEHLGTKSMLFYTSGTVQKSPTCKQEMAGHSNGVHRQNNY